jgi:hypothetical protein
LASRLLIENNEHSVSRHLILAIGITGILHFRFFAAQMEQMHQQRIRAEAVGGCGMDLSKEESMLPGRGPSSARAESRLNRPKTHQVLPAFRKNCAFDEQYYQK